MNKHFFKLKKNITLQDILKDLNISVSDFFLSNPGKDNSVLSYFIDDLVSFSNLGSNKLSFYNNKKNNTENVQKGICIIEKKNTNLLNKDILKIPFDDPKLGFTKILEIYSCKIKLKSSNFIHQTAIIHKTAKIGKNVYIGPYTVVDEGVSIENNVFISERVSISYNCKIGKNSFINSGVSIECSEINENVIIGCNTVIGQSGFGFTPNKSQTSLIPHVGAVFIGKGTNIGSCCTIDRGLINNTTIGEYVMVDNQVHIAHNCSIGDYCVLAGQVGLSGSVNLEKNVIVGGDVSIRDNLTIGQNTIIAGASKVFNSFPQNSKIGGSPAQNIIDWKRSVALQKLNLKKRKNDRK